MDVAHITECEVLCAAVVRWWLWEWHPAWDLVIDGI